LWLLPSNKCFSPVFDVNCCILLFFRLEWCRRTNQNLEFWPPRKLMNTWLPSASEIEFLIRTWLFKLCDIRLNFYLLSEITELIYPCYILVSNSILMLNIVFMFLLRIGACQSIICFLFYPWNIVQPMCGKKLSKAGSFYLCLIALSVLPSLFLLYVLSKSHDTVLFSVKDYSLLRFRNLSTKLDTVCSVYI
jgi:hypothetical protein